MTDLHDDKELRKAWLKRKFGSFDYHEELVRLHEKWRDVLRKALDRAERDDARPEQAEEAKRFRATYMKLIDAKPKPGDYKREMWGQYYATGMFRSIPDYNRYLISEGDALGWMTEGELAELDKYWGVMDRIAHNIRYTADDLWFYKGSDDLILNERSTGPIDWPPNWRDDVADLVDGPELRLRCEAGQPCPRAGWWFTPARANSRRQFQQGEVMPEAGSSYGATVWQWDVNQ